MTKGGGKRIFGLVMLLMLGLATAFAASCGPNLCDLTPCTGTASDHL